MMTTKKADDYFVTELIGTRQRKERMRRRISKSKKHRKCFIFDQFSIFARFFKKYITIDIAELTYRQSKSFAAPLSQNSGSTPGSYENLAASHLCA